MSEHQFRMAQEHGKQRVADFHRQVELERHIPRVSLRSRVGRVLVALGERFAPEIRAVREATRPSPSLKETGI